MYLDSFGGDLLGYLIAMHGVASGFKDLVQSFEGSEADRTHLLCRLIMGDGTVVFLPVEVDVATQQLTVVSIPVSSALLNHSLCPVKVATFEGSHGITVEERVISAEVAV